MFLTPVVVSNKSAISFKTLPEVCNPLPISTEEARESCVPATFVAEIAVYFETKADVRMDPEISSAEGIRFDSQVVSSDLPPHILLFRFLND